MGHIFAQLPDPGQSPSGQITGWLLAAIGVLFTAITTGITWYARRIEAKDAAHEAMMREQQAAHAALLKVQREAFDNVIKEQRLEQKEERERLTSDYRQTLAMIQQHTVEITSKLKEEITELKTSMDLLTHAIENFRIQRP